MSLRMKEIRKRLGLEQKEVAERAGMPVRRYGSYEREERGISLEDAAIIADVFDCSLDELAGRDYSPSEYSDNRQRKLNEAYFASDERARASILDAAENALAASLGREGSAGEEGVPQAGLSA